MDTARHLSATAVLTERDRSMRGSYAILIGMTFRRANFEF
jgi:hypothetical protein